MRILVPGMLLGSLGFFGFLTIHAIFIEPIWLKSFSGIPRALVAGVALMWAWKRVARDRTPAAALAFGGLVWLATVPVTLYDAWLKLTGMRAVLGDLTAPVELLVAACTGLAAGCLVRDGGAALRFAVVLPLLIAAAGGPPAIATSSRALLLFVGFLPVYLATGALLWMLETTAGPSSRAAHTSDVTLPVPPAC